MNILGLHYGHDGSCCVVKDGRLLVALSSERITRAKKSGGVPNEVIDYVLGSVNMTTDDIDAIALTDWYSPWSHGSIDVFAAQGGITDQWGEPAPYAARLHDTWDRLWDDEIYHVTVNLRGRMVPGFNIGHQKAHCASAFYTSPFKESWCMSMDSSGAKPKNNFMIARGTNRKLDWLDTPLCMIGVAYGHAVDNLQLGAQIFKAGSLMALAGYGTVYPWVIEEIEEIKQQPFFPQEGDYHKWLKEFWWRLSGGKTFTKEESDKEQARDIAASIQYVFEQVILHALTMIPEDGCNNLCLAGGSFLNCNVNSLIRTQSRFENVHLFPACSDDGCAVGAALYVAHHLKGEKRKTYTNKALAYLGPKRVCDDIITNVGPRRPNYKKVAQAIADGAVVAWFQGRSEYGPRALGNRSILADPRCYANRERINHQIKRREWFRPLSPSVLAEHSREWFAFPYESPFMLFTAVTGAHEEIPAVVHIDGTSRMQTVRREDNPHYYDLISAFYYLTGVPMLLNTSLNVDGQPILETHEDALAFWETARVDMLVLDGRIYER